MEKRTLLAVILSVIVISGSYLVQSWLAPPPAPKSPAQTQGQLVETSTQQAPSTQAQTLTTTTQSTNTISQVLDPALTEEAPITEERVVIQTDLVRVELSNRGGDIVSYKLLKHKDGDDFVEMVLPGTKESHAFTIAMGGMESVPISEFFHVKHVSDNIVEFYRDFAVPGVNGGEAKPFRLSKRYDFKKGEYLFELAVTVDGGHSLSGLDFNGAAYTLEFGPQIGPKFEKLSQRYEYRRYYSYANGKRKTEKVKTGSATHIITRISWTAIAGKYFTFIAVPDNTQYDIALSSAPVPGLVETSRVFMTRPPIVGSKATDTYRFYLGPKTQKSLAVYDSSENNSFKLSEMHMGAAVDTSGILGPLETIMKWFMLIFYKVIPNYGVAIILLTILVKLLMFPLTKKSSESTLRMQALSPKIKEIQTKFKDNPNKMNVEMADLYKKEGYNPMSGCLPMLLQIPIFFAMYNLFNNHFDLRGAMFIPGWIPDLSLPEYVWNFSPFKIPILNWSYLRILPFIYLGSQLLYGKVTQTPDQQGNSQMKMMLYMMPIMFFFILYDVPAGLLLYWIMSNLLTLVQQLAINKYLAKKRAHMAANASPEPVIAPKRKKK